MQENENLLPLDEDSSGYKIDDQVLFVDKEKKEVLNPEELKNLPPFEKMVLAASVMGIKLKKPKEDCTKPGCLGRGYVGFLKDGQPVPCSCVFEKESLENNPPVINHKTKRNVRLEIRRRLKKQKRKNWKNRFNTSATDVNIEKEENEE